MPIVIQIFFLRIEPGLRPLSPTPTKSGAVGASIAHDCFSRWYPDLKGGKHVVVVVVSTPADGRHWIITAYIARRLGEGEVEWVRN